MSNRDDRKMAEGATWALDMVERVGLDKAKEEFRKRGMYKIPLQLTNSELRKFEIYTKKNCLSSVLLLMLGCLHDEFDFGEKRMKRLMNKFDEGAGYLITGEMDWEHLRKDLAEMYNIDVDTLGMQKALDELE